MEMTSHGNAFLDLVRRVSYASVDTDDEDYVDTDVDTAENDDTAAVDDATVAAPLQTAEPPPPPGDRCPICLHDNNDDDEAEVEEPATWKRIAACGHLFHSACVERWLKVKLTCPVCRYPATMATIEEIPGMAQLAIDDADEEPELL